MTIHNLIIHNIKKEQHDKNVKVKRRPHEIKPKQKEDDFFEKLLTVYYKKSNPTYGTFDPDKNNYPYQTYIKDFLATKTTFRDFSLKAVDHFVSKIKMEPNATGGFFLVLYYTNQKIPYLAIIMLNNKANYDIDEDSLEIVEKATLDIKKIDVANIVNLSRWKASDSTYLTFTKGRKKISDYFINFIGCTTYTDSKHFSQNLKAAINDYLLGEGYDDDEKVALKMKEHSYLKEKSRTQKDIQLQELGNTIFPENPEKFLSHLTQEKYSINPTFKCELSVFRDYQYIFYTSKNLNFRFHRNLLTEQKVVVNAKTKSLTFNNIEQSVIDQIEQKDEE